MTRPGHDGMPPQGPDFAEFLRRELHAAADQLEPRSDGLERIRARVRSGPAYASKHSAAQGGFLAGLVRRWNAARGGQEEERAAVTRGSSGTGGTGCSARPWRPPASCSPSASRWRCPRCARPSSSSAPRSGSPVTAPAVGFRARTETVLRSARRPAAPGGRQTSAAQGSAPAIACASGSASSAGQAGQADDLGDAERHPGELGEQPVRQRHGQRDERRPGRRQHQPGRHHDRNRPGDRDRERHRHEHRHLDGFGEGQHQREGQGVRQGDRDTLLSAQHRHTVQDG